MITLALDASTYSGTVAVFDEDRVIGECTTAMRNAERETLMPALEDALRAAGTKLRSVSRVICGDGPGSFTSLRIAGSLAKGIAFGLGVPLAAVPSLALIVSGGDRRPPGLYLSVLDALRGEVYAAPYRVDDDGLVSSIGPMRLVPRGAVAALAPELGAAPIGPQETTVAHPHARGAMRVAGIGRASGAGVVTLASWQPHYGRLAEAQVKWEAAQGRPLPVE